MARAGWKCIVLAGLAACASPVEQGPEPVPPTPPPPPAAHLEPVGALWPDSAADSTQAIKDARAMLDDAQAALAASDPTSARELAREAIELLLTLNDSEVDPGWLELLDAAGRAAWDAQDTHAARAAWERVCNVRSRTLSEEHFDLLAAQLNLGLARREMGDLPGARALQERVLEAYERTLPDDHNDLRLARGNLAATMHSMGDFASARALQERVLETCERTLPEDHPALLLARGNLAASTYSMGDLPGAHALQGRVLEACERTLPEDHPDLLLARGNFAITMRELGDFSGARAIQERVLVACERTMPEDHPFLLAARSNLAATMERMGELPGARSLQLHVLEALERTFPEDHPELLTARLNLSITIREMGDLPSARTLQQRVLETRERTLPEDHPELLVVRMNLAITKREMGDLPGARSLQQAVLEARERTLPENHPELLAARGNLANLMHSMGDLPGARILQERVLEAFERTMPEHHPYLLGSRLNLAITLTEMGDLPGARALQERLVEGFERTLPEDHPDLLAARLSLAGTMAQMGDLPGARALQERVLEAFERTMPEDHPDCLAAQMNLAATMAQMGDLPGACALHERVLEARERTLPEDHPDLLASRLNLAATRAEAGDLPGSRTLLLGLVSGMSRRALAALALSPREAREAVAADNHWLSQVLFLSEGVESLDRGAIFELVETRRMVATTAVQATKSAAANDEIRALAREADEARARLNDLVAGAAREGHSRKEFSDQLARLSTLRDRAERTIRGALSERGIVADPITPQALALALSDGSAAVGFLRSARWRRDESTGLPVRGADHLFAHVLRPSGQLSRVELGSVAELERLVESWREALGAPILRGVGAGIGEPVVQAELEAGHALRERLLDPVLAAAGRPERRLFVCADDLVYLVPLDALPVADERVGDRLRVVGEASFAPLLCGNVPVQGEPEFLVLGAPDFDAQPVPPVQLSASGTPLLDTTRSGLPESFGPLLQAGFELDSIGALFERAFGRAPVMLREAGATKFALAERASFARYLHLATHGWFAPEAVKSILDRSQQQSGAWQPMGIEERITGFAPMTLCGLALAGANLGRDSLGRVPGILTAEELCSLDLSSCDLAVLSACETNVGIRRAGQGIQSLQAALFAAGARTSITSLWKVDDAATRKLMELFYTYLWIERLPKAEALWRAKTDLRSAGHPVRDWAAWVLCGAVD